MAYYQEIEETKVLLTTAMNSIEKLMKIDQQIEEVYPRQKKALHEFYLATDGQLRQAQLSTHKDNIRELDQQLNNYQHKAQLFLDSAKHPLPLDARPKKVRSCI